MLKRFFPVLFFAIILGGCAATQAIDTRTSADIDLVNQRLNERPATVYLIGDSLSHGRDFLIRRDSTFWTEQGTKRQRTVATSNIHAIEAAVFRSPLAYRKSFAIGLSAGYMSMAAFHLSKEDPARIATGDVFLTLGVSLATGVLGAVIYGSPPEARRAIGQFLLNEQP